MFLISLTISFSQYTDRNLNNLLGSGVLPGACAVGDLAYRTDAPAGLYVCDPVNTWTIVGGGGGISVDRDIYANIPVTCSEGDLFYPTDGFFTYVCGAADDWYPFGIVEAITPITLTDFTAWPSNTATATQEFGTVSVSTTGANRALYYKTAFASTPDRVILGLEGILPPVQYTSFGLILRESGTGNSIHFGISRQTTPFDAPFEAIVHKFNNLDVFVAPYVLYQRYSFPCNNVYLSAYDDSTNRTFQISCDKKLWTTVYTGVNDDYITADQAGFYADGQLSGVHVRFFHWSEE